MNGYKMRRACLKKRACLGLLLIVFLLSSCGVAVSDEDPQDLTAAAAEQEEAEPAAQEETEKKDTGAASEVGLALEAVRELEEDPDVELVPLGAGAVPPDEMYPVMGETACTLAQMTAFYNDRATYPDYYRNTDAPTIEDFCTIYLEECQAEGVRAEVAFCQAMNETGYLRYGGDVSISQNNFAGIGATGGGEPGDSFGNVRAGVRAQVQHLLAYATEEPRMPVNEMVDTRFGYVARGSAPYLEWLGIQENPGGKGWAAAENYGYTIRSNYIEPLLRYEP